MRRRPKKQLGVNTISIERIAKDVDAVARDKEKAAEAAEDAGDAQHAKFLWQEASKLRKEAIAIRWEKPDYRKLDVSKRNDATGKRKRYTNLRQFNRECPSRGDAGLYCELKALRCLADGTGLATVYTRVPYSDHPDARKKNGTWLLHFASCNMLKDHVRKRTNIGRSNPFAAARHKRKR